MIDYEQLINNNETVAIELYKHIKVDKDIWYDYGLYYDEQDIYCSLKLVAQKDFYLVILVCGGKHFWRKMITNITTLKEAENIFMETYKEYWQQISAYITPEWFSERGFEWM